MITVFFVCLLRCHVIHCRKLITYTIHKVYMTQFVKLLVISWLILVNCIDFCWYLEDIRLCNRCFYVFRASFFTDFTRSTSKCVLSRAFKWHPLTFLTWNTNKDGKFTKKFIASVKIWDIYELHTYKHTRVQDLRIINICFNQIIIMFIIIVIQFSSAHKK